MEDKDYRNLLIFVFAISVILLARSIHSDRMEARALQTWLTNNPDATVTELQEFIKNLTQD